MSLIIIEQVIIIIEIHNPLWTRRNLIHFFLFSFSDYTAVNFKRKYKQIQNAFRQLIGTIKSR